MDLISVKELLLNERFFIGSYWSVSIREGHNTCSMMGDLLRYFFCNINLNFTCNLFEKLISNCIKLTLLMASSLASSEEAHRSPKFSPEISYTKSEFDGTRFINRRLSREHLGLFDYLKMRWEDEFSPWPSELSLVPKKIPGLGQHKSCCQLTFVGHATTLIQMGSLVIATDPMLSERASPVSFLGPKRVRKPGVDFKDWPKIDYVLISHNHYDHMDIQTLQMLHDRDKPTFLVGVGNKKLLESAGINSVIELDWGEKIDLNQAGQITFLECQHFSGRGLFDRNKTLWGSFLIESAGKKVYFAGDTGYSEHFLEQGAVFRGIDLAVLPIGAYMPRWFMKPMHVDPVEAVKAHIDLRAQKSIGIHFGTFQLTSEGIDDPLQELEKARQSLGVSKSAFIIPEFGETYPF